MLANAMELPWTSHLEWGRLHTHPPQRAHPSPHPLAEPKGFASELNGSGCVRVRMYTCVCVCVCACTRVCVRMRTRMHTCECVEVRTQVRVSMRMFMCV